MSESNSYNLRLHNELLVYEEEILDMKKPNKTRKIIIPEEGLVLEPGRLYLGRTLEYTKPRDMSRCWKAVLPSEGSGCLFMLRQDSRCGVQRLLDTGNTLRSADQDLSGVQICQIYYHSIEGEYEKYYSGKYQNNTGIQPSLLYLDFEK